MGRAHLPMSYLEHPTNPIHWAKRFIDFDITGFERVCRVQDEDFWEVVGRRRALHLFHAAAENVPAYKDFLKKHKVQPTLVKSAEDFRSVPMTDKKNYITAYPLSARCWKGDVRLSNIIAVSSGTSGEPTFWPRGGYQEYESGIIHELIYRYLFQINKYKTLLIVGFPMGVYVSGIATVLPSRLIAEKGYSLSIACVGNNKTEMLRVFKELSSNFEQVVLVGHPFFIKDVLETGKAEGISWRQRRLRMLFCSEGFNETWRRYVLENVDLPFSWDSIISAYGSSELLLIAHETPLSVYLRTLMEKYKSVSKALVHGVTAPNLFQYNPLFRYIEPVGGELIFTSSSGLPLIRFNLHDRGEVLSYADISKHLGSYLANKNAEDIITGRWNLPFVTLLGRSDYTIIFYAANIYPEHVRQAIDTPAFLDKLTGRFVMHRGYLRNKDEYLEIDVELRSRTRPNQQLLQDIQRSVIRRLKALNMEYLFLCNHLDKDLRPRIKLWPFQHEKYFKPGLKPRWII